MTAREEAARLDADGRSPEAADAYERALEEPDADPGTYIDLAVLYFECTDPGYRAHHRLQDTFAKRAVKRMKEVLAEAEARFGRDGEIEFWKRYFDYVYLGDEFLPEEAVRMANTTKSLAPFAFLFGSTAGERYRREAEALFDQVRQGRTGALFATRISPTALENLSPPNRQRRGVRGKGRAQFPLDSLRRVASSWVASGEGMRAERVSSGPWCAVAQPGTKTHDAPRARTSWTLPGTAESGV